MKYSSSVLSSDLSSNLPFKPKFLVKSVTTFSSSRERKQVVLLRVSSVSQRSSNIGETGTTLTSDRKGSSFQFFENNKVTKPPTLASSLCDYLAKAIVGAFNEDSSNKRVQRVLSDNFAPTHETPPATDLPITGSIPECLNGEFLQIGPNPRFKPFDRYHWFDGDGMIHGLNIKNGKATYVARYVKTSRLQQEEQYGGAKFAKIGDMKGIQGIFYQIIEILRFLLGILDPSKGLGPGNTALVYHNKKLLALYEQDKPYAIKVLEDGDLETEGLQDYDSRLQHPFTAHPKIDSFTGEMFFIGWQRQAPFLTYRVVSKAGDIGEPVAITLPQCVIMHDFAITENYAFFMDLPLGIDIKGMATGEFMFKFDPSKECRFGILPRYAKNESQIRWFKVPTCFIFHIGNAWEEGDEIVLIANRMPDVDLYLIFEHKKEKTPGVQSTLYEYRMNLKTGELKHKQLSELSTDFPRINDEYTGRKVQYMYCSIFDDMYRFIGVAKYDLTGEPTVGSRGLRVGGNIAGIFNYGPGRDGGEAVYVPRIPGVDGAPEDDGYLISFVRDNNTGYDSFVLVIAVSCCPACW